MVIMFRTLNPSTEGSNRRCVAFICGLFVEALVISAAVLLGVLFPKELTVSSRSYALTWIRTLRLVEKPVVQPSRELARVLLPKLKSPEVPKLLAVSVADLEIPKNRRTVPPPEHPLPVPTAAAAPAPNVKEQIVVRTGLFGGAAEPVTTKQPVEVVQTGGFGKPEGLPSRTQKENTGNTPVLGAFGLPSGPGRGNGTAGNHGVQGVVMSVGFGSGVASVANGRGDGTGRVVSAGFGAGAPGVASRGPSGLVAMGGFEKARPAAAPVKVAQVATPVEFQPIEILSKPAPSYTDEARRLGIQGDVALSVVFLANGSIRINGVVQSLGHGLDQEAEQVAAKIRFKPALRAGQPADFPATVRIEFRLAGQAS
jgi:TonB family protein